MTRRKDHADVFGSTLGGLSLAARPAQGDVQVLEVAQLRPRPGQPRRHFDDDGLSSLAASLRDKGVLQPLLVRPAGTHFEIVAGERRWRAAQLAGLRSVPATVRDLSDAESDVLAAVENLQREDLNRHDEVSFKLRLIAAALGTSEDDAAVVLKGMRARPDEDPERRASIESLLAQLGRENLNSFVTNGLPVLHLPPALSAAVRSGELEFTKARVIAGAPPEHHAALVALAVGGATVAELRERVRDLRVVPAEVPVLSALRRDLTSGALSRLQRRDPQGHARAEALMRELRGLLVGDDRS